MFPVVCLEESFCFRHLHIQFLAEAVRHSLDSEAVIADEF